MGLLALLKAANHLEKLDAAVESLQRDMAQRDIDWQEMKTLAKRILRRAERDLESAIAKEVVVESDQQDHAQNGGPAALGGRLSDHQKLVQQQIPKRRAGL